MTPEGTMTARARDVIEEARRDVADIDKMDDLSPSLYRRLEFQIESALRAAYRDGAEWAAEIADDVSAQNIHRALASDPSLVPPEQPSVSKGQEVKP